MDWSGLWCFYQLFRLSFWRHPFTAEDPLLSKWCNATFLQICSHEETHLHLEWPESIWSKYIFLGSVILLFCIKWFITSLFFSTTCRWSSVGSRALRLAPALFFAVQLCRRCCCTAAVTWWGIWCVCPINSEMISTPQTSKLCCENTGFFQRNTHSQKHTRLFAMPLSLTLAIPTATWI